MEYLDIITLEKAKELFPDVLSHLQIEVSYLGDVSRNKITEITGKEYDFVIANQVIEHVPNPIKFLNNLFAGVKENGYLIISAPDRNLTYDKHRNVTDYNHLIADYYLDIHESDESHYIDAIINIEPEALSNKEKFIDTLKLYKARREHVHVWTRSTFEKFLKEAVNLLDIEIT